MPAAQPAPHAAFNAQIARIEQELRNLASWTQTVGATSLFDSGWLAVVFENAWKNVGAGFLTAAYRKQGNVVRLRGTITGGASGTNAFTLPEGFRPTATTFSSIAQGGFAVAVCEVSAAGGVDIQMAGAEHTVGLDGTTFTVD